MKKFLTVTLKISFVYYYNITGKNYKYVFTLYLIEKDKRVYLTVYIYIAQF